MRNEKYLNKMKEMMDKFSVEILGNIMEATGVRLCELNDEQVKLWNKCIRFYNETFNLARDMAKDMDETKERQEREIRELRQELTDTRRNTEMIIRMLEADKKKKSSSATTK